MSSVKHQHESAIGVHMSLPSWISLPSPSPSYPCRLIHSPHLSSLRHAANFHLWSILYQFSCSVVSDYLLPHGLQHARLSWYITNSQSLLKLMSIELVISSNHLILCLPLLLLLQSFPASGYFPISFFFASGGQGIGVSASASVLPMNIQDWFHLGLTGLISLQSKGLLRVFSNTFTYGNINFHVTLSTHLTHSSLSPCP